MTARQILEALQIELNKANVPSMLLQDFNYMINKAINQYINKQYNIYDTTQQTTDNLRVLKATTILKAKPSTVYNNSTNLGPEIGKLFGSTYEVNLPLDYLHLLNCICIYKVKERFKCYDAGDIVQFAARRLTADVWSLIVNDYYNRPLPERPYYYIHNVNTDTELPTNPITSNVLDRELSSGTDVQLDNEYPVTPTKGGYNFFKIIPYSSVGENYNVYIDDERRAVLHPDDRTDHENEYYLVLNADYTNIESFVKSPRATRIPERNDHFVPKTINVKNLIGQKESHSLVEKEAGFRYGNSSNVRLEIRYGKDDTVFELVGVVVDYIKTPQLIRITQEQIDLTRDTSQIMEFPDYVCQEIINELVMLVMENTANPRLQTHIPVTQSIATPTQQQATTKKS